MLNLSTGRLSLLLLAMCIFSLSSCDDDDDTVLGIDFDDDGTLFISSNTSGEVGVYNIEDGDAPEIQTFPAEGQDADGIFYEESEESVYQVNRSNNTVVEYDDVLDDLNDDDEDINIEAVSEANLFTNGRGLAQRNERLVVAEDGENNGFVVFDISDDDNDMLETVATYETDINLWGIQFVGDDLYAVVDNSDSIAIFNDFLNANTDGDTVMADRFIQIEGITRTHGLEYNAADDIMILTDIGDAGSTDNDGALIVILRFSTDFADNTSIEAGNYTRIAGATTQLNNPVDVAWDDEREQMYVAERANEQLLIFNLNDQGDVAPSRALDFAGISSLYLHRD